MPIAEITLDREWLRRIRGKLSDEELISARNLADQDIRTWFRRLFGAIGRDEVFEIILDDDGNYLNVAEEMIADYESNHDHDNYAAIKALADTVAANFAMDWADFMSGDMDDETSAQYKLTERMVKGRKKRLEAVTFMTKVDGTRRYFQRFDEYKGMHTKKKSRT